MPQAVELGPKPEGIAAPIERESALARVAIPAAAIAAAAHASGTAAPPFA
jgi:hypothetical protein